MFDLIDKYTAELFNEPEFKRLLELKSEIEGKYSNLIIAFKTNEAKYNEMKQYGDYVPGLEDIKKRFVDSKAKLYSIDIVKEYFMIEGRLQQKLTSDLNEIKENISNKFKLNKGFNF